MSPREIFRQRQFSYFQLKKRQKLLQKGQAPDPGSNLFVPVEPMRIVRHTGRYV